MTCSFLSKYLTFFHVLQCFVSGHLFNFKTLTRLSSKAFWLVIFAYDTHVTMGTLWLPFRKQCDFPMRGIFLDAELGMAYRGFDFFLQFSSDSPSKCSWVLFHTLWIIICQISPFPNIYMWWPCFEKGIRISRTGYMRVADSSEYVINTFSLLQPMDEMLRRKLNSHKKEKVQKSLM